MKQLALKLVDIFNLYPLFNRYTKNTATVFMLHAIVSEEQKSDVHLYPSQLDRMLGYLKEHNYTVLSLSEVVRRLKANEETYKTVVFTVDDGYRDFYLNAYECFKRHDYPATIFLTSDFIEGQLFFWWDTIEFTLEKSSHEKIDLNIIGEGEVLLSSDSIRKDIAAKIVNYCKKIPNTQKLKLIETLVADLEVDISDQPAGKYEPLRWEEILEMQSHGIDFHPHTKTHPIMAQLTPDKKIEEVSISRRVIEERTGRTANIFCYPNGQWDDFDEETISALKNSGYIAAVVGMGGFDNTKSETDMFRLRRFGMPGDLINFKQYISGLEHFKYRVLG